MKTSVKILFLLTISSLIFLSSCKKTETPQPAASVQAPAQQNMVKDSIQFALIEDQSTSTTVVNVTVHFLDENGNVDSVISTPAYTSVAGPVFNICSVSNLTLLSFSKMVPEGQHCNIELFRGTTKIFRGKISQTGYGVGDDGFANGVTAASCSNKLFLAF